MDGVERIRTDAQAADGSVVDIRTEESSLEEVFLDLAESEAEP
jgi:ABC-2 type transport system ATP-binding protein